MRRQQQEGTNKSWKSPDVAQVCARIFFSLLQSCWQLELVAPWCRRGSNIAGFQQGAELHLDRAEVSSILFPHQHGDLRVESKDGIDLGWQQPDLKNFSLNVLI